MSRTKLSCFIKWHQEIINAGACIVHCPGILCIRCIFIQTAGMQKIMKK